jgi:hypothetical protein
MHLSHLVSPPVAATEQGTAMSMSCSSSTGGGTGGGRSEPERRIRDAELGDDYAMFDAKEVTHSVLSLADAILIAVFQLDVDCL